MRHARFMTGPLSILLDLVRGLAALAVVLGHTVQMGLYTGPFPFTIAFQHNAVLTFFVVSGIVIAASVEGKPVTLADYAIARVSRILPVALPALLFAAAVAALDASRSAGPLFAEDAGGVRSEDIALGLLFLTESYRTELPINPPFWSLCYEVWYYAMFAAATFLRGRMRIAWIAIFVAIAGPNALLSLPVWLAGVAVVKWKALRRLPAGLAVIFIAVALIGLYILPLLAPPLHNALRIVAPWTLGFSLYAVSDALLGICLALGFTGLRAIMGDQAPSQSRAVVPIRFLADISFSLYILHWPLMKLLRMMGIGGFESWAGLAGVIALVIAVSAGFASLTERRRQALRAYMRKALGRDDPVPAGA